MAKKSSPNNSEYFANKMREASAAEKPVQLVQFLRVAIVERERGELEVFEVGNQVVTLIGDMPQLKSSLAETPNESERMLDELYRLGGNLGMAGRGGTFTEADEMLWQEFKALADKYARAISR